MKGRCPVTQIVESHRAQAGAGLAVEEAVRQARGDERSTVGASEHKIVK
jgi:hypothetical protein